MPRRVGALEIREKLLWKYEESGHFGFFPNSDLYSNMLKSTIGPTDELTPGTTLNLEKIGFYIHIIE